MPELPEVETIVRELREAALTGVRISHAIVFWQRSISELTDTQFCQKIASQTIKEIQRRGKFLVFRLTRDTLLVHLRMTGKFMLTHEECAAHAHERVRLYLSDRRILRFEDQRKFGKWYLTSHPERILDNLGLEPLSKEFTVSALKTILSRHHRQIKPLLLDQKYIAGLGNIYVDEALWAAKIHPQRSASSLKEQEIRHLHHAIVDVLTQGVENTGTSLGAARANYFSVSGRRGNHQNALNVFRKDGLSCTRCGSLIKKMIVAQRGTHYCPNCQPF